MPLSYDEAFAAVTGPGQDFELVEGTVRGVRYRLFKNAPPTLGHLFARARGDESTFLVYEDERWTFDETMRHVDALAHALVHTYGVRKGDRVGIAMRNLPEWVVAFAAILSVGAVSVSLNAWWTEPELTYGVEDSGLSVLVADPERVERSERVAAERGIPVIVVRTEPAAALPDGFQRYEDVVTLGDSMPAVDVGPDDDATILYTSGTTGFPKGAVSTHRAVVHALMAFWANTTIQSARRGENILGGGGFEPSFILIVPLFHVTGCVPVMLSCFGLHYKLVMMRKWEPEEALRLIEAERVTTFVGVPTQSWDLLECPTFADYDTSSLVSVGGGGAPAPATLVDRVEHGFRRGRPNIGYGMTETNAYGPGNTGDDYVAHPTSTGRARTTIMDVEIRDELGAPLPVGSRGQIWLKGPNVIRGYWNKPEATAETIVEGWLATGDIGRIDEEGFLYVEDRAKDMVLRGGENVYCAEVESAIYEHPAVYEAAVFGIPHERLGEEVACVVQCKHGASLAEDELRAFLSERLAPFKVPSRIVFSEDRLPRNPSGKMLKRELRSTFFDVDS
ncbi:MAG: class I adenylate-forming enzyme family protein [Acidimicrobiales bacterium]